MLPEVLSQTEDLSTWCMLSVYRGSIAHGMYVLDSNPNGIDDKDVLAICIPTADYYFGLKEYGSRGTKEIKIDEWDVVVYEFRKMMRLLRKGNPNVLSSLWLDDEFYIKRTYEGDMLIENRDAFVGKHVYKSFVGYAYSQLKKLERNSFQGYMGVKRKKLVETFGYDPKNAAHLIRLLRMGIEFLNEGCLYVTRSDAAELLDIKLGKWSLEQVKSEADRLFVEINDVQASSSLPDGPDIDLINRLAVDIIESWYYGKYGLY